MSKVVDKFISHDWDEFTDKFDDVQTCNHTMDGTKAILKDMGYSEAEVDEICEWFEYNGGYCDCEVFLNVVMGNDPRGLE
jgi:hypothetical protein